MKKIKIRITNIPIYILIFVISISVFSCHNESSNCIPCGLDDSIFMDTSYLFKNDISIDTFELIYENKQRINNGIKDFHGNLSHDEFLKYVNKNDSVFLNIRSKFVGDTITIYYNNRLVYYNDKAYTDLSLSYTETCTIKKGKKEINYIGVKINQSNIYWALLDREYRSLDIDYLKGKLYFEFHNQILILD